LQRLGYWQIADLTYSERSAYVCDDVCSAEGIDKAPIEFVIMVLGRGTFGMKEHHFHPIPATPSEMHILD